MATLIAIVSIILNGILGVALFFKSSLNKILEEWWKDYRNKKSIERQKLVQLRARLVKQERLEFLALLHSAEMKHASDEDKGVIELEQIRRAFDSSTKEWALLRDTTTSDLPFLPMEFRQEWDKYMKGHEKIIGEIFDGPIYKQKVQELSKKLQDMLTHLISVVDQLL